MTKRACRALMVAGLALLEGFGALGGRSPGAAWAADGPDCSVRVTREVPFMPPPRDQAETDFCFVFTSLALVQQRYCAQRSSSPAGPCRFDGGGTDDRFAILDAMRAYGGAEFGFAADVLGEIAKLPSLARESCAPFAELVAREKARPPTPGIPSWYARLGRLRREILDDREAWDHMRIAYGMALDPARRREFLTPKVDQIRDILASDLPIEKIVESFDDGGLEDAEALARVLVPNRCTASGGGAPLPVPGFRLRSFTADDTASFARQIARVLRTDRPVEAILCTGADGTDKRCAHAHDTVVAGMRDYCCGSRCRLQYKVYDSWGVRWTREPTAPWIDADDFLRRVLDRTRASGDTRVPRWHALHWLD